jgi:hypothetical protein
MVSPTCPKCRHAIPDAALDDGQCPACGFPIDGPLVIGTHGRRWSATRFLVAAGAVGLLAAGGFTGYTLFNRARTVADTKIVSWEPAPRGASEPQVRPVAPLPHEPRPRSSASADLVPTPPVSVEPPKKNGPRPIGVVMKVDPRVAPVRRFDHPDDTAALPDLNTNDRVVLTGRVRALRLGSINGKGSVDASGLVAEEVIITGDMNGEATVTVSAPNGTVTIGGYVAGASKLTIRAPGGQVLLAKSGRFTGGSVMTITAKRLDALGVLSGGTGVNVTFTPGGGLKLVRAEEGAIVTYKKAAPGDPEPTIETGELRDGAKVVARE